MILITVGWCQSVLVYVSLTSRGMTAIALLVFWISVRTLSSSILDSTDVPPGTRNLYPDSPNVMPSMDTFLSKRWWKGEVILLLHFLPHQWALPTHPSLLFPPSSHYHYDNPDLVWSCHSNGDLALRLQYARGDQKHETTEKIPSVTPIRKSKDRATHSLHPGSLQSQRLTDEFSRVRACLRHNCEHFDYVWIPHTLTQRHEENKNIQ